MSTTPPLRRHLLPHLAAALALGAPATAGCTPLLYGVASSMNVTTPDVQMDLGDPLLTTVALAFLPVDIFLTWVEATYGIEELSAYLERERRELRLALARGNGQAVSDLAHALALPADLAPRLGAVMRAHRGLLDPPLAAPGPIDAARAKRFLGGLGVALRSDPALAEIADQRLEGARMAR